jgi:hypothetical protein
VVTVEAIMVRYLGATLVNRTQRGKWMTSPPGTLLGSVLVLLRWTLPKRGEGEAHVGPHPGLPLGEEHHYHVL